MLRTVSDQPTLWETVIPECVLGLPRDLAEIDALLDDPRFFEPFRAFFHPRIGRPSIPMEVYLRMMFLKYRYRLGFEPLCDEVADSLAWRGVGSAGCRSSATTGKAPVILDLDASLVDIHSENKEGTAANYKHGFGFSPMFCFADATGEALAGVLRPGNATANDIADQLAALDAAVGQLPARIAAGHHPGDAAKSVRRAVEVRADSAGCSPRLAGEFRARNISFSVVARTNPQVQAAISRAADDKRRWSPSATQTGGVRDGAAVAELTDLIDLSGWPSGTRLIVRREPLHPGAQTSLFPSLEFRFWGHYTDRAGTPVDADLHMRAHAHVEDHIRRLKASGLERFPFTDLDANRAWMALVCFAADLVRWFQLLCLTGPLAKAEPKRLRWQLWHTPARVIRHARRDVVRILDDWPDADQLLRAYRRIALLA